MIRLMALSANARTRFSISWSPGFSWNKCDSQSGERLESITWEDSEWKVTVGTEDNEQLGGRSHQGEYMPRRLSRKLYDLDENVVDISRQGVDINLPLLHSEEVIQVQFDVAIGPNRGEEDISTWLAMGSWLVSADSSNNVFVRSGVA